MNKIFIDGGAHKGEVIEVLLDKRPDLKGCDLHFFEPNSKLIYLLDDIKNTTNDYNVYVHNQALWIEDTEVLFLNSIGRWNTLASTILPEMVEVGGLKLDRENPEAVKSISLSNFLDTLNNDDYIVLKLDVEGSEYYIINDLFISGKISMINELYIEWHDHFFPHLIPMGNKLRNQLTMSNIKVDNNWI